jgi:S1-C subfamily serine protease
MGAILLGKVTMTIRFVALTGALLALVACGEQPHTAAARSTQDPLPSPQQLSSEEIAAVVTASVVVLALEDDRGQPTAFGTGFNVGPGLVVTNYHVIRGATSGTARAIGASETQPIRGTRLLDPRRDLALLDVSLPMPELVLQSILPPLGQEVFAIGNPHGLEGSLSHGLVSGRRAFDADSILQITAPISPGSSGGPVVNRRGEVVGVATASLQGGQNLNFAIPAKYVQAMLDSASETVPLRATAGRRASTLFDAVGEVPTTGVTGGDFLWDHAIVLDMVGFRHGQYTFSLRNTLDEPLRNVRYALIFRNAAGEPLHVAFGNHGGAVPPRLGTRVAGRVDGSVQSLTTTDRSRTPRTGRVDIRVLAFDIVR